MIAYAVNCRVTSLRNLNKLATHMINSYYINNKNKFIQNITGIFPEYICAI